MENETVENLHISHVEGEINNLLNKSKSGIPNVSETMKQEKTERKEKLNKSNKGMKPTKSISIDKSEKIDRQNIINEASSVNSKEKDYQIKTEQNYELIFSPRTTYSNLLEKEDEYFTDLTINFDPITIKMIKKHFKERLGVLNRIEFISILKNHLLSWHPDIPDRERIMIKLLDRLFSEIDLNDNGTLEWGEFTNYIIHNSNSLNNRNDDDNYRLRFYSVSRKSIDVKEVGDNIAYAFYVEKYNLIGIVDDLKFIISFYDANTFQKLKCFIDIKEIQKDIDDLDDKELEERANLRKKQIEENLKKIKAAQNHSSKKKILPKLDKYKSEIEIGINDNVNNDNFDKEKRDDERKNNCNLFYFIIFFSF
jgi:hypothetical protein